MTTGNIKKTILKFAFPIFLGNLFQQLYNIVDTLVVGNTQGKTALAAIGSTGPLIFLLVGFFGGLFMGVGVTISHYFGANDKKKVEDSISTALSFGLIAGVVLTIIGTIFTPALLELTKTPSSVMEEATIYVQTYFMGIIFLVLYNTASGIFQAVGDSRHPLYYLIISSITNVILDLLFIIVFDMGIRGAAIATVIAQALSVFLAFKRLLTVNDIYRIHLKKLHVDMQILIQMLKVGLPAGLQNSIIAIANVFVQSNINTFADSAMAGNGAYTKIEGFAFIPITSFCMSLTTFVSQNLGANKPKRVKQGTRFGIISSLIIAECIGIIFFLFSAELVGFFSKDPEVIAVGVLRAQVCALFYFLLSFSHSIAGILRGAGKSLVPMFIMLICWCIIRVSYIHFIMLSFHKIEAIFWAYPLTWFLSSTLFLTYYLKSNWNKCTTLPAIN